MIFFFLSNKAIANKVVTNSSRWPNILWLSNR